MCVPSSYGGQILPLAAVLVPGCGFLYCGGVPDSGRVFKSRANHGSVCSCLHRGRAIAKVSLDKSKGFVGLVYSIINVLPPGEIFTDGNSQVLAAVNYFQCVSMDLIVGIDYSSPVRVDPEYGTFLRVELHLLGCFPSLQGCQVLLKKSCVLH